jgi:hypothetical protein
VARSTNRLEVESVPVAVRERAVSSVEALGTSKALAHNGSSQPRALTDAFLHHTGGRVTVGDVAAKSGLTVAQAEGAVRALAADTGATLKVSPEGDLLYVFPAAVRAQLAAKSWRLRVAPAVAKAGEAAGWLSRVLFGASLLVSLAIVVAAITALSASSSSDSRDRGRRGGGVSFGISPFSMFDFYFWDTGYMRRRRMMQNRGDSSPQDMGFLESVFSFVFGDGNPEELDSGSLEQRRWRAVGDVITSSRGVVTAEQLAPLLDLPPGGAQPEDESYVLPALVQFNGVPEVSPEGHILYRFPDLAKTASQTAAKRPRATSSRAVTLQERRRVLTKAPPSNVALTLLLGAANAFGVYSLTSMMGNPAIAAQASREVLTWVSTLLPGLQLYAASFFLIPAARYLALQVENAGVEGRNAARAAAAALLQRPEAQAKLREASQKAGLQVFDDTRAVFSTNEADAKPGADAELADFDARLNRRDKRRN